MGLGTDCSLVYCLDFGLASLYRDKDTNTHYSFSIGSKFRGTVRYSSINGHIGIRQSRRDDLESLGYMFVYFLKGLLCFISQLYMLFAMNLYVCMYVCMSAICNRISFECWTIFVYVID